MIILSCKDICKSYGIRDVLKDITFSINDGDKVGIIGANGEGKSTLFKIITKEISQDSGEIFIDKNKTLGYLSQNLALDSDKNIYEEALSVFEELLNIEERLSSLEIKMNEPYDENNASYHEKLIKDYTTLQDIYSHKGGYVYKEYLETTGYYQLSAGIYNFEVLLGSSQITTKYIKNITLNNNSFHTIYIIGIFNDKPPLGYLFVDDEI